VGDVVGATRAICMVGVTAYAVSAVTSVWIGFDRRA